MQAPTIFPCSHTLTCPWRYRAKVHAYIWRCHLCAWLLIYNSALASPKLGICGPVLSPSEPGPTAKLLLNQGSQVPCPTGKGRRQPIQARTPLYTRQPNHTALNNNNRPRAHHRQTPPYQHPEEQLEAATLGGWSPCHRTAARSPSRRQPRKPGIEGELEDGKAQQQVVMCSRLEACNRGHEHVNQGLFLIYNCRGQPMRFLISKFACNAPPFRRSPHRQSQGWLLNPQRLLLITFLPAKRLALMLPQQPHSLIN